MEALIANVQENAVIYGVIAICLTPLIYLTRKYSVPPILYAVEFSIYATGMHVAIHVLVGVTRWFKESSSMKALAEDGKPLDAPTWSTPLVDFWDRAAYDPIWVWKFEVVLLVIILMLMWRYRPMQVQRKSKRKTQEYGKSSARGKAGGYSGGAGHGGYSGRPGAPKKGGFKAPRNPRGR